MKSGLLFARKMIRLMALMALFAALTVGVVYAQETTECEAGFKLVEHVMGKVCVTENPERIIALEWKYVEDVLALGVQPLAIADIEGYNNWVKIPVELGEDVQDVGSRQEPNLELIAQLEPDLIIGVSFRVVNNFDELNAIAPTLVFDPYPTDGASHYDEMISTFTTIASVLNREAEAAAVLAELDAHFAEAKAALEAAGHGGETYILSQTYMSSDIPTFRLFTDNAMAAQILQRIGLDNAWEDEPQFYGFSEVTIEAFADVEDTNFFYIAQEDHNDFLTESPLWNSLPFVKAEHAYWLGGDAWLFGGALSAEVLVDSVLTAMGIELPETEVTAELTPEVTVEP